MDIKTIVETIEILCHAAEEVGTTAELAEVTKQIEFWQRKLQEAIKSK